MSYCVPMFCFKDNSVFLYLKTTKLRQRTEFTAVEEADLNQQVEKETGSGLWVHRMPCIELITESQHIDVL